MAVPRIVVLVSLLCLLSGGCAQSFVPRPSPRIVATDSGFTRDGQSFSVGLLGGGALELVQGNPRAEAYAQGVRRKRVGSLAAFLAGMVAMPYSARLPGDYGYATVTAVWTLTVVSSLYLELRAEADLLDAVNVYNDDLSRRDAACSTPTPGATP